MRLPGIPELLVILLIVMVIFGAAKLPQIGSALGKSIREFRKGTRGDYDAEDTSKSDIKSTDTPTSSK